MNPSPMVGANAVSNPMTIITTRPTPVMSIVLWRLRQRSSPSSPTSRNPTAMVMTKTKRPAIRIQRLFTRNATSAAIRHRPGGLDVSTLGRGTRALRRTGYTAGAAPGPPRGPALPERRDRVEVDRVGGAPDDEAGVDLRVVGHEGGRLQGRRWRQVDAGNERGGRDRRGEERPGVQAEDQGQVIDLRRDVEESGAGHRAHARLEEVPRLLRGQGGRGQGGDDLAKVVVDEGEPRQEPVRRVGGDRQHDRGRDPGRVRGIPDLPY